MSIRPDIIDSRPTQQMWDLVMKCQRHKSNITAIIKQHYLQIQQNTEPFLLLANPPVYHMMTRTNMIG